MHEQESAKNCKDETECSYGLAAFDFAWANIASPGDV